MGENTYYFTKILDAVPDLLVAREYDENSVHIWELSDEGFKNEGGEISFTLLASWATGKAKNMGQIPELEGRIYLGAESEGWIIAIGDQYFATKKTLIEKFVYPPDVMACG